MRGAIAMGGRWLLWGGGALCASARRLMGCRPWSSDGGGRRERACEEEGGDEGINKCQWHSCVEVIVRQLLNGIVEYRNKVFRPTLFMDANEDWMLDSGNTK
eukprot:scaffold23702_cov53-Cyclotella_meneghiniana.AAC.1